MSIRPCHGCKQRVRGKLSSLYWAWFLADDQRVAWKQNLCLGCLSDQVLPILRNINSDLTENATCPACGGSSADDADPVFLILYLPKQIEREFELNTDAACAAKIRANIVAAGERLEDRSPSGRGPTPQADDPWTALEL